MFALLCLVFDCLLEHSNDFPIILVFKRAIGGHRLVSHTFADRVGRHGREPLNIILPVPDCCFQSGMVMQHRRANTSIYALVQQSADGFADKEPVTEITAVRTKLATMCWS